MFKLPNFLRAAQSPKDTFGYAPRANGRPDPGEVCWAWVPFEDDPQQGKDRPVLVLGTRTRGLRRSCLALMLTSKDHDSGSRQLSGGVAVDRFGRAWMDVGTGGWDRQRRPSEVRLDRLLEVGQVRREGSSIDQVTFDRVLEAARRYW